jgi:hypothetical protein
VCFFNLESNQIHFRICFYLNAFVEKRMLELGVDKHVEEKSRGAQQKAHQQAPGLPPPRQAQDACT